MSARADAREWEYVALRLSASVNRWTAATQLTIQAEFQGWELARVLMFGDGSRKVWLRRKPINPPLG